LILEGQGGINGSIFMVVVLLFRICRAYANEGHFVLCMVCVLVSLFEVMASLSDLE